MENKKPYIAPEMKVVELEHSANLLQESLGITIIPREP
jgi:hypothetical protein